MVDVSIVIVCMNNLKNLYTCLDSIKKYTLVSYEVLVVAYLFSNENLKKVRTDYPWVLLIESNEIRGFSENNNLALRQANGEYCFILNDDTFIESPVIDSLLSTFEKLPQNAAIVSPNIKYPNGEPQYCGRNKVSFWTFLESSLGFKRKDSQYGASASGVLETYNVMGAAFLIKTDIFRKVGFFDEYYFFCPEDLALSTLLIKMGYTCYVNADVVLYHIQGGTCSVMQIATEPAHYKGSLMFYSENSILKRLFLIIFFCIQFSLKAFIYELIYCVTRSENAKLHRLICLKKTYALISSKSPKELFVENYMKIKRNEF